MVRKLKFMIIPLLVWLVGSFLAVGGLVVLDEIATNDPDIILEIEIPLEKALQVKEFDYKFERYGIFSGAGGQGSAIVWLDTQDEFLSLAGDSNIFYEEVVNITYFGEDTLERVYIAGVKNEAYLLGYAVIYASPPNYKYSEHSSEILVFEDDGYTGGQAFLFALGVVVSIAIFLVGMIWNSKLSYDFNKEIEK